MCRVSYLGRKSELKLALREVRDRETGMRAECRSARRSRRRSRRSQRGARARPSSTRRLAVEQVDVTLPAELLGPVRPRRRGSLHPSTQVRRDVEDIFLGLGYEIVDGREVETTRYNFDALGFPDWHPSRSPRASLYLGERHGAAHRDVAGADPQDGGARGRRSTWSRSAASTGATRSTRRTSRSSTSSRGSRSTRASRWPTSRGRCST